MLLGVNHSRAAGHIYTLAGDDFPLNTQNHLPESPLGPPLMAPRVPQTPKVTLNLTYIAPPLLFLCALLTLWGWQQGTCLLLRALPWPCRPIRRKDGLLGHETPVFLRTHTRQKKFLPFPQPSALSNTMSHHEKDTQESHGAGHLLNLRKSSAQKVTSSRSKNLVEISPSLGFFFTHTHAHTHTPLAERLPCANSLKIKKRRTLAKKFCEKPGRTCCLSSITYLSNMTTPSPQSWIIRILPPFLPSNSFLPSRWGRKQQNTQRE